MRSLWPFLLIVVPLLEISVFVLVGGQIGVLATILAVLTTATIGMALLRHQGLGVLARVQRELNSGGLPGRDLAQGAMLMVAGLLLLTPGFVTDTIGLTLFIPGVRDWLFERLKARVGIHVGAMGPSPYQSSDDVIDIDATVIEESGAEEAAARNPQSPWNSGKH